MKPKKRRTDDRKPLTYTYMYLGKDWKRNKVIQSKVKLHKCWQDKLFGIKSVDDKKKFCKAGGVRQILQSYVSPSTDHNNSIYFLWVALNSINELLYIKKNFWVNNYNYHLKILFFDQFWSTYLVITVKMTELPFLFILN